MRRAAWISAVTMGLLLAGQTTATAGIFGKDCCETPAPVCERQRLTLPTVWRSQGCGCDLRHYVLRNTGLCHKKCFCPPAEPPAPQYLHVTRAPRDFWMLH